MTQEQITALASEYAEEMAAKMQNPQYSDTHCIKVSHDREVYERMTDEERAAQPIIGGLHELKKRPQAAVDLTANNNPYMVGAEEDLPF